MNKNALTLSFLACLFIAFAGCGTTSEVASKAEKTGSLQVVATTGQINSALTKLIAGTDTKVNLFCGPGVDPHSFSASIEDVQAMLDANLIVFNGFHLEAKLAEYLDGKFKDKAWAMASAFPIAARLDWLEEGEVDEEAPFDPHIWNHLPGWSKCVEGLAEKLAEADPENAETYRKNAKCYVAEIMNVHSWAKEHLANIPEERRTIVSAHDAFNYFAKEYGMETLAVLGVGNDPEADILTMRKVAEQVCNKKIPAIFMESITNPKVSEALKEACDARDWQVTLVSRPLYSDDLGSEAPQNTYLGAFKSNVEVIIESLK